MLARINDHLQILLGELQGNSLEAFWFTKIHNAGDLVTPFLLRKYGFTPILRWPPSTRFFGCGSILNHAPADFTGYVLGSGFLRAGPLNPLPHARVLALRGEKTRARINAPASTPLGDPGLLVARFLTALPPRQYTLGLIPHYVDRDLGFFQKIHQRYPRETHFIDIQASPTQVIREIARCEFILSTSLHGVIFANSLHIPVIWPFVNSREAERSFKFADYASALKSELLPVHVSGDENLSELLAQSWLPPTEEITATQTRLDQAFHTLQSELLQ